MDPMVQGGEPVQGGVKPNLDDITNTQIAHAIENGLHATGEQCPQAKLTQKAVDFIREHREYNSKELSEMFGVSKSHINQIRRYECWRNS